jgi:hypothetical protein
MKNNFIRAFASGLAIIVVSATLVSCETSDGPKKKKPAPPPGTGEYSNLGWNRPQKWEGSSRFGGMMPQSR